MPRAGVHDKDLARVNVDQVLDPATAGHLDLPLRQRAPAMRTSAANVGRRHGQPGVANEPLSWCWRLVGGLGIGSARIILQASSVFAGAWLTSSSQFFAASLVPKTGSTADLVGGLTP